MLIVNVLNLFERDKTLVHHSYMYTLLILAGANPRGILCVSFLE